MKVKMKLNWVTQLVIVIFVFVFIRLTFRPDTSDDPSILNTLPGLAMFLYAIYLYYTAVKAKRVSVQSFKVKTNKIVPVIVIMIAGFLLFVQALIFVFQKDHGYHTYFFIMNTGMFSSFVLMALYYLIFTKLYITQESLFFRSKINITKYKVTCSENKIELFENSKYLYVSYVGIEGKGEDLNQIAQIINTAT